MATVSDELLVEVRRYQASMLKNTYCDLMEDEGFKKLLTFILDTIYTPEDINAPTETFNKVYDYFMERPKGEPVTIITRLWELRCLSEELDRSLAQNLSETGEITDAAYENALRACNNRKDRERHIELFVKCITTLHRLSRHPLNAFMFKVMKLLMSYLGRPKAVKTVEEGYNAFRGVEDIYRFTDVIRERELARLERVYKG